VLERDGKLVATTSISDIWDRTRKSIEYFRAHSQYFYELTLFLHLAFRNFFVKEMHFTYNGTVIKKFLLVQA